MTYAQVTADPKYWSNPARQLRMSVGSGACLIFEGDAGGLKLTCHDLATTMWGIHKNIHSFKYAFNVHTSYSSDIDGGGRQMLSLYKGDARHIDKSDAWIIFSPSESDNWLYEADLWEDVRKDYEPAVNKGRHKFSASEAMINVADSEELLSWMNKSYIPWTQKLSRITRPHSTLPEWVNSGLDMGVMCLSWPCTNQAKVPTSELRDLMVSGATLESLLKRLTCSRCGKRKTRILPL